MMTFSWSESKKGVEGLEPERPICRSAAPMTI